jgi:two-component system response regulator
MATSSGAVDILLIEDTAEDAELTIHSLSKWGTLRNLHWVRDGVEALDFLFATGTHTGRDTGQLPKLILLDLRLPRLGGVEFLRRIKADDRTRGIPVVVLTSSKEYYDITECHRLGVTRYLAKPVVFEEFLKIAGELVINGLASNAPRSG